MSSLIYFIADLYPWWGIPLAFIFAELANYYRRHGNKVTAAMFILISISLALLAAAYFYFNGMERLRPAMQNAERSFFNK